MVTSTFHLNNCLANHSLWFVLRIIHFLSSQLSQLGVKLDCSLIYCFHLAHLKITSCTALDPEASRNLLGSRRKCSMNLNPGAGIHCAIVWGRRWYMQHIDLELNTATCITHGCLSHTLTSVCVCVCVGSYSSPKTLTRHHHP